MAAHAPMHAYVEVHMDTGKGTVWVHETCRCSSMDADFLGGIEINWNRAFHCLLLIRCRNK
jgi:hypothetical protein